MNGNLKTFADLIADRPEDANADLGDFARRIAMITVQLIDSGKVKRSVAIEGMNRLRSDLISKGAQQNEIEPITRLLAVLQS